LSRINQAAFALVDCFQLARGNCPDPQASYFPARKQPVRRCFSKVFLDGNNKSIWDVIDNPGLHPHQLANKIHAATGLRLDGRQVRYLIDNRLF